MRYQKNLINKLLAASFFISNLAIAQNIPTAKPEDVGMSSARLKNVKASLQAEVDKGNIPGAVVMINRKGKLVYSEVVGYQDKSANKAMSKDSIFRIYSMTKPLASVAAMILVEEGKMQLADPISKFMPEFANMQVSVGTKDSGGNMEYSLVPAAKPITVQDLLRHTSGIGYPEITSNPNIKKAYTDAGLYVAGGTDYDQRRVTPQEMIAGIAKAPLSTQPGTNWEYGMSVDLLGRVVEVVSGKRLGDFLQDRVFTPLQMKDTAFSVPTDKKSRIAEPFATDPFNKAPIKLLDVTIKPSNDSGGAGAAGTAGDYMNFASMMLNGGELNGQRILSPMTVNLMASDMLGNRTTVPLSPGQLLMGVDGYTFGLGFMVRQGQGLASVDGSPGEYMWAGAAGTFFWIDPKEQLAVVVMSQVPGPIRPYYRRMIKQLVSSAVIK
ncbi:serine hydrolase domain-containing protein [Polynucleobacter sp. JS-JIR-II-c23]|uniref:serine hydrolase domain-containing protein n=1 Tax=Polynucleobacter sp. JS-JIR-II-c23 TaxID=1758393 RepID=UPI002B22DFB3|nr:serine hydrolase domain-containing protein [Polynucleobacter sp. JS-JIR-II-c23]MEA9603324.1 serine hydrolase domain-containing protein [Polynucleobacter sp. JS-JIR-II-c23]